MEYSSINLDKIRIQTARMMEIYVLLRNELENNSLNISSKVERQKLGNAIETIRNNMLQTLEVLSMLQKECKNTGEQIELEELLNSVLKWHAVNVSEE
ncbi:MAG: hypothetical protein VX294_14180 [Candidatus Latescibacterota bacterium]|nr:hypothetical protein [Candidatus Latescibacterota bacterium]